MNRKSLIGLLLFFGYPFLLKLLKLDLWHGEIAWWFLLVLMLAWIFRVEKRDLSSVGWQRMNLKSILTGIGLGLVLFIVFGIVTTVIQALGLELNQEVGQLIASQPFPLLLLIALRAGIVEELLYRSFSFERILELTGKKWLAALLPVLMFTLVHLNWGVGHLFFVFIGGMLFMSMYMAKRNLGMIIIAHFTTDVFALLVIPLMVAG